MLCGRQRRETSMGVSLVGDSMGILPRWENVPAAQQMESYENCRCPD